MAKDIYTVAWTMPDEQIIKLKEPDKVYDVSDKVDVYLKKTGQYDKLDDKKVEVEIDETENEDGNQTIVKISLVNKETAKKVDKTEEPEQETETTSDAETRVVKILTVSGVSPKNKGVIFKEEEDNWYTLDSTIDPKEFKDKCTKKKVQITIAPQDKGNDIIKSYFLTADENVDNTETKTEEPEQKGNKKDAFYRIKELERQVRYLKEQQSASFEAQSAVNSANQAISGMTVIHEDSKKTLKALEGIAIKNFEIIQKLKAREIKDKE